MTNQYEFDYEEDMDNFIHLFMPSRVDQAGASVRSLRCLQMAETPMRPSASRKQACKFPVGNRRLSGDEGPGFHHGRWRLGPPLLQWGSSNA